MIQTDPNPDGCWCCGTPGIEHDTHLRVVAMSADEARATAMPDAFHVEDAGEADQARYRAGAHVFLLFASARHLDEHRVRELAGCVEMHSAPLTAAVPSSVDLDVWSAKLEPFSPPKEIAWLSQSPPCANTSKRIVEPLAPIPACRRCGRAIERGLSGHWIAIEDASDFCDASGGGNHEPYTEETRTDATR